MENCVFEYLYRDASNYKAFGVLLLNGTVSRSHRAKIVEVLDGGEFFVAEQVGVPTLYEELWKFSNGPTEDDHVWHTFVCLRAATTRDLHRAVWGTLDELVDEFSAVKKWNLSLSPHYEICW
jgi:hypothetical protein